MIAKALQLLRPGAQYTLIGGMPGLDGLTWMDQLQTAPTELEVEAEISRLQSPAVVHAELVEERWEAIKAKRDHLSDTGGYKVVVAGVDKWFHSDAKSKTQQLGLARKADRTEAAGGDMDAPYVGPGPGGTLPWKTMDGTYVVMTANIAQAVFDATEAQDKALFAVAEFHNAQMRAAPDPAAYDFSGGWPAVYVPA